MSKSLSKYLNEIKDVEPLTYDQERALIVKAKKGNRAAYDEVVRRNLRFVVKVAKSYEGQGLPLEDLISEGNYGLVKALDRFDLDREVKLISYGV